MSPFWVPSTCSMHFGAFLAVQSWRSTSCTPRAHHGYDNESLRSVRSAAPRTRSGFGSADRCEHFECCLYAEAFWDGYGQYNGSVKPIDGGEHSGALVVIA